MGGAWAARVSLACPLMAQHSVQIGIGIKFARQNQDGFPGQNQVFACLAAVVLCCCVLCCLLLHYIVENASIRIYLHVSAFFADIRIGSASDPHCICICPHLGRNFLQY
jgi:hypothetical protein